MSSDSDHVSAGGGCSSTRIASLPDGRAEAGGLCQGELREFLETIVADPENQFCEVCSEGYSVGVTERCGGEVEEVWVRIDYKQHRQIALLHFQKSEGEVKLQPWPSDNALILANRRRESPQNRQGAKR